MRLLLVLLLSIASGTFLSAERQDGKKDHDHDEAHQPTSTRSFADVERWTGVFDDPSRAAWQKPDEIPAGLGLKKGMVVADIGAGTGYFERFFAEAVGPEGKVYAVDIEPSLVEHLGERARKEKTPNVIPTLAVRDNPNLPDAAIDVIFICDTWHHIGDRVEYLGLLATALKPGGAVAVVDFKKQPLPVGPAVDHKLAREEVVGEFAEAGWQLSRESDILPYQYFLIFEPPAGD